MQPEGRIVAGVGGVGVGIGGCIAIVVGLGFNVEAINNGLAIRSGSGVAYYVGNVLLNRFVQREYRKRHNEIFTSSALITINCPTYIIF